MNPNKKKQMIGVLITLSSCHEKATTVKAFRQIRTRLRIVCKPNSQSRHFSITIALIVMGNQAFIFIVNRFAKTN